METLVADATAKSARIVAGGSRIGNRGYFYPLTVLADVLDEARAMHEEPFGPLALLSRVKTLDDAIEKANSLPYGLAAYAFTNSARNVVVAPNGFWHSCRSCRWPKSRASLQPVPNTVWP
jgi:succinate-semialdehyde dehydrogenase/glutarate-semialdehyde dehydrogenase